MWCLPLVDALGFDVGVRLKNIVCTTPFRTNAFCNNTHADYCTRIIRLDDIKIKSNQLGNFLPSLMASCATRRLDFMCVMHTYINVIVTIQNPFPSQTDNCAGEFIALSRLGSYNISDFLKKKREKSESEINFEFWSAPPEQTTQWRYDFFRRK